MWHSIILHLFIVSSFSSTVSKTQKGVNMKAIFAVMNITAQIVFITAKIAFIFTSFPQFTCIIFIYSQSFIYQFTGLYDTNVMTSSQLARQLCRQSTAPVSQRSWVQILYKPEFFSGLIFTTAQVIFITVKIAFIFMSLTAVRIYDFYLFTVTQKGVIIHVITLFLCISRE